jgi:hypothetical protein
VIAYTKINPPASEDNINVACGKLNIDRGSWLVGFWKKHDGAMLNDRILIYSTAHIAERNETYHINIIFPEHVLVGDDSGGCLILIPKSGSVDFYFIDAGDPLIDEAEIYNSIESLVENVVESEDSDFDPDIGNIVSVSQVKAHSSEILGVKKELGLGLSIKLLAEKLEVEGSIVLQGVNINKYKKALSSYSHLIKFVS